jgi:hypothetical protein
LYAADSYHQQTRSRLPIGEFGVGNYIVEMLNCKKNKIAEIKEYIIV